MFAAAAAALAVAVRLGGGAGLLLQVLLLLGRWWHDDRWQGHTCLMEGSQKQNDIQKQKIVGHGKQKQKTKMTPMPSRKPP